MNILEQVFGIKAEYDTWDKKDFLPLYIADSYKFQSMRLNSCRCILLTPIEELAGLPALKKQIKRIQEIDNVPVVFKLTALSQFRKKNLIENGIAFVTTKQIYLPFMCTYLQNEEEELQFVEKFMFSTQLLVLLYMYGNQEKLYVSDATKILPFSAMTMSRAVKQLEATELFYITKDGVNKVIEAKHDRRELFEQIKGYLTSPVCKTGYIQKENLMEDMVFSGETVLAERTMLNDSNIKTYAVSAKKFDSKLLMKELVNPEKQYKLELWGYDPMIFAKDDMADIISVILSFSDTKDERIEEAIDELLESMW